MLNSPFWFGFLVCLGSVTAGILSFIAICLLAWTVSARKVDNDGR